MTHVLVYHAEAPFKGQEILDEELRRAEDYFDTLSRIHLKARQAFRAARRKHFPEIAKLDAKLEALEAQESDLRKQVRELRAKDRKRTDVPLKIQAQVKKVRAAKKELLVELSPLWKAANNTLLSHDETYEGLVDAEMARRGQKSNRIRGDVMVQMLPLALESATSEFWRDVALIHAAETQEVHEARKHCGCCPGTYLLVEKQVQQSCKAGEPTPRYAPRDTLEPEQIERLSKRQVEGRAGAQVVHLTRDALFTAQSNQLQIDPYVDDPSLTPRQRARRRYTTVRLKLLRGVVSFRVLLHREIPLDADVCQVWIQTFRQGTRWKYELVLVIKSDTKRKATGQAGALGFDLGYRKLEDGSVRVGTFVPEHGGPLCVQVPRPLEGLLVLTQDGAEMRIPAQYMSDYSRTLRKAQDDVFNLVVDYVQERRKAKTLPAWCQEDTAFIAQWRNPKRLTRVAEKLVQEWAPDVNLLEVRDAWRRHCQVTARKGKKAVTRGTGKVRPTPPTQSDLFPSPDIVDAWLRQQGYTKNQAFALTLYLWRRKNRHLYQWTCDQKGKDGRWLADVYRVLARTLADTYSTLVFEDFDLRGVSEKPDEFSDDDYVKEANRQRHIASTSRMRTFLVEAFGTRVDIHKKKKTKATSKQPAQYTTRDCHLCHGRCKWPQDKELTHTCEHCGETWDQDYNAAWNLLRLHLAEAAQ